MLTLVGLQMGMRGHPPGLLPSRRHIHGKHLLLIQKPVFSYGVYSSYWSSTYKEQSWVTVGGGEGIFWQFELNNRGENEGIPFEWTAPYATIFHDF